MIVGGAIGTVDGVYKPFTKGVYEPQIQGTMNKIKYLKIFVFCFFPGDIDDADILLEGSER